MNAPTSEQQTYLMLGQLWCGIIENRPRWSPTADSRSLLNAFGLWKDKQSTNQFLSLSLTSGDLEHFQFVSPSLLQTASRLRGSASNSEITWRARGCRNPECWQGQMRMRFEHQFQQVLIANESFTRLRATQKDKNREHGLWETNSEVKDNWKPKMRIRLTQ